MIKFKNGFTVTKKELDKKTLDELYSLHSDLITSYGYGGGSNELDKFESYLNYRINIENEVLFAI